ncbi:hypothetical protein [Paraflavitalea pollutisoli]|uniref:hypothetical protein n=1 Tax=Paraflavitalea pollutisoli TaxID=3034143 RepID=UPI0023EAEC0C|nr:hypothetical protein [Paraflavitalea sp. H1-2-19X]
MLNEREQEFIRYWEANRLRQKQWKYQLLSGIPIGLIFAVPVLAIAFTGKLWYKRADMAMNAQVNPLVLVLAVFVITVFVSIFYKRHQWDMREQQYQHLKAREEAAQKE